MSWLSKAISKLPGGGVINAIAKPVQSIARGAIGNLPGGAAVLGAGDALGRMMPGGGIASSLLAGSGGGGGINPAVLALAGLQTANAAQLGKTANDYSNKAWSGANDSYTQRAGLRSGGVDKLLNPAPTAQPGLSAIRGSNPYARVPQPPIPLAGAGA